MMGDLREPRRMSAGAFDLGVSVGCAVLRNLLQSTAPLVVSVRSGVRPSSRPLLGGSLFLCRARGSSIHRHANRRRRRRRPQLTNGWGSGEPSPVGGVAKPENLTKLGSRLLQARVLDRAIQAGSARPSNRLSVISSRPDVGAYRRVVLMARRRAPLFS
jgi:hypothetical protein